MLKECPVVDVQVRSSLLSALEHVQNVEVDLALAEVKVYSDAAQELNRDTLVSTIEDLGFDVVS